MPHDTTVGRARDVNPWPDLASARSFLQSLVVDNAAERSKFSHLNLDHLSDWLIEAGLGALTYQRYKEVWPDLADRVRDDYYLTAMSNSLHMERLARVADILIEHNFPYVLLKGAALNYVVYDDRHVRPMSDVDLWLRRNDIPVATQALVDAGLKLAVKEERPFELQVMSDGELAFRTEDGGLIEVHWSPYAGWWLQRTANIDNAGMWQRVEPLALPEPVAGERIGAHSDKTKDLAFCLSPEDTVLHLAVHAAVNHQFGMWGIRSIVDVSMVMNRRELDWQGLVARAYRWRLATVLWSVLRLEQLLIGSQNLEPVLSALQPPRWRRALLARVVEPQFLLELRRLGRNPKRFVLLLLLTDRVQDAARLVWRTLWPERVWLDARYGSTDVGHVQHLWRLIRSRTV